MGVFLTSLALVSLISDALVIGVFADAHPPFASPTPKSCDVLDGTGFTPKPTTGPVVIQPLHQDLKRQAAASSSDPNSADFYTCGWISGTLQACEAYGQLVSDCIWNPQYSAIGCCTNADLCHFYTTCLAYSELPSSCGDGCSNSFTDFCDTYFPECAKVTYASGTDQYSSWYCATAQQPVQTLTITSGTVTFTNLPRYWKSYYGEESIGSYVHQHITLIVGCGVAGIVGIVAVIGWGWWRRRGRSSRRRTPAGGATPESQRLFAAGGTMPLPPREGQEYCPMYDRRGRGPPAAAVPSEAQYYQAYGNTATTQTYSGQGYSNQPYDPAPVYRH